MGGSRTQPTQDNEGNGFSTSIVLLPAVLSQALREMCALTTEATAKLSLEGVAFWF